MPSLGVDVSNYTDTLTAESSQAWKDGGFELVIVQAIDPPAGYPVGKTRAQVETCQSVGLVVDAYIWLWFDLDTSDIRRKLGLLDGLNIRRLWLDVEDMASGKYDQTTCEQKVSDALALCDDWQVARGQFVATGLDGSGKRPINSTGIYSGRWYWAASTYMGNTTNFSDRKLWDANYDLNADASAGFIPYGGWDHCDIKQYQGSTSLNGISGVDLNALSESESASLYPSEPPAEPPDEPPTETDPRDQRISDLMTALGSVTGQSGEIRMALAGAQKLPNVKSVRLALQAIDARLGALNAQFLGS